MLEKYYKYKMNYRNYLIFIKIGSFYECFDKDALIVNDIFDYKLKKINNNFKVGFPIGTIDNIINILKQKNLYYLIIDNDEIVEKCDSGDNLFTEYNVDFDTVFYNYLRIENIIKVLNNHLTDKDFDDKLKQIEELINE